MRVDQRITLRRMVRHTYPVLNFLGFTARVATDSGYHAPAGWPKEQ
jgi:hypothetical protein